MLTRDLVRLWVRDGRVHPRFLDPAGEHELAWAERLIGIVRDHVGRTRGELDEALREPTDGERDWRVLRGLTKLLSDRLETAVPEGLEPPLVRARVFECAAALQPLGPEARAEVMAAVAAELSSTPEAVEDALYGDLAQNQRVVGMKPITPDGLVQRYNVALVQAALLQSTAMTVELDAPSAKRLRQLVRYMKFFRLLFRPEAAPDGVRRFVVDGPVSVVHLTGRYGMALANFFPALLLCEQWRLVADYQASPAARPAELRLDSTCGLRSHYRDTGTWTADEETALETRLRELSAGWTVRRCQRVIDLDGRGTLVPDLVVRDPATGRTAYLEIAWRWRRDGLRTRWDLLREAGPPSLVLAVCSAQGADAEALPELPGPVHTFKGVPNARAVWKLLREAAA